jgi:hypothetical protein
MPLFDRILLPYPVKCIVHIHCISYNIFAIFEANFSIVVGIVTNNVDRGVKMLGSLTVASIKWIRSSTPADPSTRGRRGEDMRRLLPKRGKGEGHWQRH